MRARSFKSSNPSSVLTTISWRNGDLISLKTSAFASRCSAKSGCAACIARARSLTAASWAIRMAVCRSVSNRWSRSALSRVANASSRLVCQDAIAPFHAVSAA